MRISSKLRMLVVVTAALVAAGAGAAQGIKEIPYDLPARKTLVLEKIDAEVKSLLSEELDSLSSDLRE